MAGLILALVVLAVLLFAFARLAGLPDASGKPRSEAMSGAEGSHLGRLFSPLEAANPGRSGVLEIPNGRDAFAARAVLARQAELGIDAQYYMWHQDTVGRLLIQELLAAADRGVRVRLLVDDMYGSDGQKTWLAMDVHPNVEVRLFAPYSRRQPKYLQFLTRFRDVNARMHTKTFTADGVATIVGGRNIGDEYFDADPDLAFADNDVLAIGPVARQVSAEFDDYWNGGYAYPVSTLLEPATEAELQTLRQEIGDLQERSSTSAYLDAVKSGSLAQSLRDGSVDLLWSTAEIVHDSWRKRDRSQPGWRDELLITQLAPHILGVTEEVIMISPYFVPGASDVEALCGLARDGVSVKILTNSLASNDVAAVHAGYSRHRTPLLRCGVEIYELNEQIRAAERRAFTWLPTLKKSSLHAKSMVFDEKKMFVGSFNFDQRSMYLNTEIGLVFEQPEIAGRAARHFDQHIERFAFRLELVTDERGHESLRWHGLEEGRKVTYESEPYVGAGTRLAVRLIRWLPIEWLL